MHEAAGRGAPRDLEAQAQAAMRRGSLSFYLAARLLPPAARDAVWLLYRWCRFCDDAIDGQELGAPSAAPAAPPSRPETTLAGLRRATKNALEGRPTGLATADGEPVFAGLALVTSRYHIPAFYPLELLAGMQMDVEGRRYRTLDELVVYCYRVAGTVGLMFCNIVGVSAEAALRHAAELGIAMQLTNIARDICDDRHAGRVYLPEQWLADAGLTPADLTDPAHRGRLAAVAVRLLDAADGYYRSGDAGLRYLPLRAAVAVAAARNIYADIGVGLRNRGARAWDERQVVSTPRKLLLVIRAVWQVAKSAPRRWLSPWRPVAPRAIWRLP